jgi:hypothetical protein
MKRIVLVAILAAAFGSALPTPGWAQINLDGRVTISFTAVPPSMLFGFLAKTGRFELTLDPALQRSVTITLQDVKLRTLLDATCDSIGCRWSVDGNKLVVQALPPNPSRGKGWIEPPGKAMPAGSRFVNTPVETVLDAISRAAGEGSVYTVEELDPKQMVTVDVSNQDPLRAIALLATAAGLKPGSTYTIMLKRPAQKLTIIKTVMPKDEDSDSSK